MWQMYKAFFFIFLAIRDTSQVDHFGGHIVQHLTYIFFFLCKTKKSLSAIVFFFTILQKLHVIFIVQVVAITGTKFLYAFKKIYLKKKLLCLFFFSSSYAKCELCIGLCMPINYCQCIKQRGIIYKPFSSQSLAENIVRHFLHHQLYRHCCSVKLFKHQLMSQMNQLVM